METVIDERDRSEPIVSTLPIRNGNIMCMSAFLILSISSVSTLPIRNGNYTESNKIDRKSVV